MRIILFCVVFQIVYYELAELAEAAACKFEHSQLPYHKLKEDLFCDYEKTIRPRINQDNATNVIIKMVVKSISFDMHSHALDVNSWFAVSWKDDHLQWKPEEYGDISQLHISSDEIWVPDISIYNLADQSASAEIVGSVSCLLHNTGTVVCVPPNKQTGLCVPKLSKYPFDTQNCTLRYGSWIHTGEQLNIKLAKKSVSLDDYEENPEFKLLNVSVIKLAGNYKCCPNSTFPTLNYHFILQRLPSAIAAVYVVPAIVLIVLTLTTLWLSIETIDRLCICCSNLVIHFLYIGHLWWTIPSGGLETPLLIIYARDSLFLASFTLILTVLLRTMQGSKEQTPFWVSVVVGTVLSSRPGKILFMFDTSMKGMASAKGDSDAITIVDDSEKSERKDWVLFANIIDKLCFFAFIIIYFCMFIAFIM